MDEHQHDAAAIEDGLARILGRCIKKINRARRQEKRLKKYRDEDQEPPEDLKKEVRKRRNELRTSIEEVLNFQEGADVAEDAAAAAASSDEEDAAIYPALADLLEKAYNALDSWKGAAVRARNSNRSEDVAALSARRSEGREALENLRAELQTLQPI
ncbi:uncharacterized protein LOC142592692 isoform X1 [Dermacentor variabilis]|uniref:uncharacterized protein LOC142592692 isoform X1 n=1 Tax=Dermacentor variabilis TaxID=34621 RepID=UPI003F5C4966